MNRQVVAASLVVACACAFATADDGVSSVDLKGTYNTFALDPSTGSVAAVDFNNDSVTLYPREYIDAKSSDVVGPVKVGAVPTAVVCKTCDKDTYFVVACVGDNSEYANVVLPHALFGRFYKPFLAHVAPNPPLIVAADCQLCLGSVGRGFGGNDLPFRRHGQMCFPAVVLAAAKQRDKGGG
jgi:hypothetical protein